MLNRNENSKAPLTYLEEIAQFKLISGARFLFFVGINLAKLEEKAQTARQVLDNFETTERIPMKLSQRISIRRVTTLTKAYSRRDDLANKGNNRKPFVRKSSKLIKSFYTDGSPTQRLSLRNEVVEESSKSSSKTSTSNKAVSNKRYQIKGQQLIKIRRANDSLPTVFKGTKKPKDLTFTAGKKISAYFIYRKYM